MDDFLIDPGDPGYILGVAQMDDTHQEFIRLVNRIPTLQGQDFVAAFNELFEHTRKHFDDENQLMEASGFPAIREHSSEHLRVLGELDQIRQRMHAKASTHMARTYVEFGMPLWFKLHAATMDSALAAHLKNGTLAKPGTEHESEQP